jgi:hypothetical protein
MTHILISSHTDGTLAAARAVIARDEEELLIQSNKFSEETVDNGIGDVVTFLTEEDLVTLQNLDVGELYDTGT